MAVAFTPRPPIDFGPVREEIARLGVDGWLLYDFRGNNPIALAALGLRGAMLTRRFFFWVPAAGRPDEPTLLIHRIETQSFEHLPFPRRIFTGWRDLDDHLRGLLAGATTVAMEIQPPGGVPYLSRVDAGTADHIRSFGVKLVSAAPLSDHFLCRVSAAQLDSHRRAVETLYDIVIDTFGFISGRLRACEPVWEHEAQDRILAGFAAHGLSPMGDRPIVAAGENGGNPHYVPDARHPREIRMGDVVLIDLWAKEPDPDAIWGDITWMGYAGTTPPDEVARVWACVRDARERGLALIDEAWQSRREALPGNVVDRAVRDLITARGYGEWFTHRTGHNIGAHADHGDGPHLDDLETRDDRLLVPGLVFSIEPGVYLPGRFGVRSEIDVATTEDGPRVFTPRQQDLILLGV